MAIRIEDSVNGRVNGWPGSEQSQQKIRVVVVDDQRLFRESVAGILSAESFISVVGIAADGLEAVELVRQLQPDVVLMDIEMEGGDGIADFERCCAGGRHVSNLAFGRVSIDGRRDRNARAVLRH